MSPSILDGHYDRWVYPTINHSGTQVVNNIYYRSNNTSVLKHGVYCD